MKALRRSIKGEKETKPHVSITPKSAVAIVPPKKVIRALYDYEAQSAQELSFSRGDFFHVIGREHDQDWYEACNPALPDARGLVPVAFFQALGRTERDSAQSDSSRSAPSSAKNPDHDSGYAEASAAAANSPNSLPPLPGLRDSRSGGKNGAMVYGIVMYDFQAERADELEAKAGEAIIVIAQSNPEWFVAKPIGRLGGPGLIPVSFVEIRDMASNTPVPNPQDAVRQAGIPKVEEWKKMAADYKNSSITLGKFEGGSGGQQSLEHGMERMSLQQGNGFSASAGRASQGNGYPQPTSGANSQRNTQQNLQMQQQQQQGHYSTNSSTISQLYAPISAQICRYCFAEDKYWFVIEAMLEDGRHWELSRYYEDFYDFQIALLTEFPAEAGNTGAKKRTLPYMPGPVNYVTDAITEGRLHNLDAYVKNLLTQPPYIARCDLVKQFFNPRQGDYEIEAPTAEDELDAPGYPDDQPAERPPSQLDSGYSTGMAPGRIGSQQPSVARQPSSLSQPSQSSLSPGISQQPAQAMKVKLSFSNELVAIRVPMDIQFRDLCEKIRDRLKISAADQMLLSYKDDASGDRPDLINDYDLDMARNEKLTIFVDIS